MKVFNVVIKNWEIYNPRKDVKQSSWFRMEHNFFDSSQFFGWSPLDRVVWLYLLCEASKQRKARRGALRVHVQHFTAFTSASEDDLHRVLSKLKELQVVEVRTLRGSYAHVTPTSATNERTNETERNGTNERNETERTKRKSSGGVRPTGPTWEAYSKAYQLRYGAEPVRNASVNGQMANFFKRIGEAEAPLVAEFYLSHNDAYYVRMMHSVGALLKDAEKLRTEWATGNRMNSTKAKQAESRSTNVDVVRDYYAKKHGAEL